MASLHGNIRETYQSIVRRIAIQIIKRMRSHLLLEHDTVFLIKGLEDNLLVWNSEKNTLTPIRHNPNEDSARFGEYDKIEIEIKEEPLEEGIGRQGHFTNNIDPIFHDKQLGVKHFINYLQTRMTLTFTFKSGTWESMQNFKTSMARLLVSGRSLVLAEVEYYVIPEKPQVALLETIYKLKEKQGGNGESFEAWMERNTQGGSSYRELKNRANNGGVLSYKEKQRQLLITIHETQIPEAQKREKGSGADASFEASVIYECPFMTTLEYPLIVHNQQIPYPWFVGPRLNQANVDSHVTLDEFQKGTQPLINAYEYVGTYTAQQGIRYPSWDSWQGKTSHLDNGFVLSMLLILKPDCDKPNPLTGYTPLVDYDFISTHAIKFGPGVLRFLKDHHKWLLFDHQSPFVFQIWQGNERVHHSNLFIDKHLTVHTNYKLEHWQQWHLTIDMAYNFTHIERDSMVELMKYPDALAEIYQTLYKKLGLYHPGKTTQEICDEYFSRIPMSENGLWLQVYRRLMLNLPMRNMSHGKHIEAFFYKWLMEQHPEYKSVEEAKEDWYHFDNGPERHKILMNFQTPLFEFLKAHHDNPEEVAKLFYGIADIEKVTQFLNGGIENHDKSINTSGMMRTRNKAYVATKRQEDF